MKSRNSGFSLIELIIALSILMILSGIVFLGINISKKKSTEKSARDLCNQIRLLRTVSMAKAGEWRLSLYEKNGEYYCVQERLTGEDEGTTWEAASEETKLGHKGTVFYQLAQDMDVYTQEESREGGGGIRTWRFNRDTGSCIQGAGIMEVSGTGRTMEVAVYPENGRCEARAKGKQG